MNQKMNSALHDAYASEYDDQVQAYDCHIADVLFGLCYEFLRPGQCLLDLGIGSGLSALLFAKAGLEIYGFDFSPAMLEICRAKGFAKDLKQHDLQQVPWPYPSGKFDHLVCCGVLHFISDLELIFYEAGRVLRNGGIFVFSIKVPDIAEVPSQKYEHQSSAGFEIFFHSSEYVNSLLTQYSFERLKTQKCFIGEDLFSVWVVKKGTGSQLVVVGNHRNDGFVC